MLTLGVARSTRAPDVASIPLYKTRDLGVSAATNLVKLHISCTIDLLGTAVTPAAT
jgi:hypothetical protein